MLVSSISSIRQLEALPARGSQADTGANNSASHADVRIGCTARNEHDWTPSAINQLRGIGSAPLPIRGGLTQWQIRRVTDYIHTSIDKRLSVVELATLIRLSLSHFHRSFRTSLGETPHRYIFRVRLESARRLMRETATPLSHIATECGFSDQQHFNRLFKKRFGTSPAAWRRAHAAI